MHQVLGSQSTKTGIPPLYITAKAQDIIVNEGNEARFFVKARGVNLRYQWQKDEINIPGATSSSYVIASVGMTDQGRYRCLLNNNFDSAESNVAILNVKSNSINEKRETIFKFRIYPNPASSMIYIESSIGMTGIQVINNAGQIVWDKIVDVNKYKINVAKYEKGIYYIKIETAEGNKLCKITVN